ncbi:MAG: PAS and ANTAR domain-containing protein [Pedococcus sp.]
MRTVRPRSPISEPVSEPDAADVAADVAVGPCAAVPQGGQADFTAVAPQEPGAPKWDPLLALTAGTAEPAARFRYDVASGDWWWSPGMFELHGLVAGELEPSTGLLMAHKHPGDLAATQGTLRHVLATGEPFCCRHRVVDAHGQLREVLSIGEAGHGPDGSITTVQGYFVDLTDAFAATTAASRAAAAVPVVERRRFVPDLVIEQAKGTLIAAFGLTADAALELLSWRAEETGVDVPAVARGLVAEFGALREDDLSPARRACAYLGLNALDED